MSVKAVQENVIRFTDTMMVVCSFAGIFVIPFVIISNLKSLSLEFGGIALSIIGILILVILFFIWWKSEKQGIVLDLNEGVINFKPKCLSSLFKKETYTRPFGKLNHETVPLDKITGIAWNSDIRIKSDNKITAIYKINVTGTFGSKITSFRSLETAQSFYQTLAAACNLE